MGFRSPGLSTGLQIRFLSWALLKGHKEHFGQRAWLFWAGRCEEFVFFPTWKKNVINHLHVLGPCWPGAGLVVSVGLATLLWVSASEKPLKFGQGITLWWKNMTKIRGKVREVRQCCRGDVGEKKGLDG